MSPTLEFDWENMPSVGMTFVYPEAVKACYRALYAHHKANKPITEFKFTYYITAKDLGLEGSGSS